LRWNRQQLDGTGKQECGRFLAIGTPSSERIAVVFQG
jgi:hypothetical protein